MVIGEHIKSKAALKKIFNFKKKQFKKLKKHQCNMDMELALKTAHEELGKAKVLADEAEELVK